MYYTNFDKLFNSLFDENNTATWKNYSTTFVPSKFAVDIIDDKAQIALSVLGHNPKNIEINCYEDKIEVKAKKDEEKSVFNQLVGNINETITLGKDLDGRSAKAEKRAVEAQKNKKQKAEKEAKLEVLKRSKYSLLKNEKDLTEPQKIKLEDIKETFPNLFYFQCPLNNHLFCN